MASVSEVNLDEIAAAQGYSIEQIHATSTIEKVAISSLQVDRSYQREPTQSLVDDIAENWDEVSSELLLVSDRGADRGRYVVNGQHRTLGARKRGLSEVWARVIDLASAEDPGAIEAMFRLRTNKRMGDKPLERFKAQVRAGDPESRAIQALVERFGTEINEVPTGETGINAVAAVEKLYRLDDGALLSEVFQVIKDTWGYVGGKSASASLMNGLAWFIYKHAEESDRVRLTEKMKEVGLGALDRRARTISSTMGGTLWLNYYRGIVDVYNERLHDKSKLEWKHGGASSWRVSSGWGKSARND